MVSGYYAMFFDTILICSSMYKIREEDSEQ